MESPRTVPFRNVASVTISNAAPPGVRCSDDTLPMRSTIPVKSIRGEAAKRRGCVRREAPFATNPRGIGSELPTKVTLDCIASSFAFMTMDGTGWESKSPQPQSAQPHIDMAFSTLTSIPASARLTSSCCSRHQFTPFVVQSPLTRNVHARAHDTSRHPTRRTPPVSMSTAEVPQLLQSLYKFSRPHTIRGTFLAAFAGCARALLESPYAVDWRLLPRALLGLLSLVFGNVFIVGINQIYDVSIDKVNKPFLPLAAGSMTTRQAKAAVALSAVAGLAIVRRYFSPLIFQLYAFGLVVGALYSVPPIRLRRFPLAAALCISCARGFLLNFGVYHATKSALKMPFAWSAPITFLAAFMTVFATVIAISKDMPDIRGDREYKVQTFASRLGPRRLAQVVVGMLAANYVFALGYGWWGVRRGVLKPATLVGHAVLLLILLRRATRLNVEDQASIKEFYYGFIWNLFYAEYLLFPFI
eukprot:Plantae.Rhodophyta-Rhodochaete_pulchella.ctg32930.p1 GENE.Plantae.Rhodophyta-Rhodochaete_pulchella.ctg32930~~Plantae.Rhodophyta-Rhodochaete_pulchella.ctg32930.p1  ORF type:complete len:472 (-),score=41.42 Plantae.Rhodophyta-Rhodochaete_pulchella.ctg32930:57-1472(-)